MCGVCVDVCVQARCKDTHTHMHVASVSCVYGCMGGLITLITLITLCVTYERALGAAGAAKREAVLG